MLATPFDAGCANGCAKVGAADADADGAFANALVEKGKEGWPVGWGWENADGCEGWGWNGLELCIGFCGCEDCIGKGFVLCGAPIPCPPNGMPVVWGKSAL